MAIVGKPINWNYVRPPAGGGYYMGTNNWTYWPLQPMAWSFWVAGSMVSSGGTGSDYSHTPFGANYQTPYVFTPGIDNGWGVGIHAQFPFPIYGGTFYGEPFAEVAFFGWDPNGNAFAKVITVGFPEPGTCYGEIDILATPGVDPSLYSMVRFIDNSCLSRPYTNDLPRFNGHYPPDIIFYGRPDWWDHRPGSGTDDGGPIVPGGFMPVGIVNCATGVTMSVQSKTPTGSWTTITNVVTTAAMFGTNGWDNSTARVTILNQTNGTKKFYRAYGTNYGPLW